MALAPGTYEYLFVVDGQWTPDPSALEVVPNPFGGCNSILKVLPASDDAAPGAKGGPGVTKSDKPEGKRV